jgi:large subunit ribosomal protein L23
MIANNIIIRPIITEKSMKDTEKSVFSFVVAKSATKDEIKKAVEKVFQVNVVKVATNVLKGGTMKTGAKRIVVKNQPVKKAFVQLKKGEKISAFELGA